MLLDNTWRLHYREYLEREAAIKGVVLICAEFRIANIWLENLEIFVDRIVAYETIAIAQLRIMCCERQRPNGRVTAYDQATQQVTKCG